MRGPQPGGPRSYVMTEEIRAKMRASSAKRWEDRSQRDHLSKLNTIALPAEEIRSLYASGWSMKRIGTKFGVSADKVMSAMRDAGIESRIAGVPGHHWHEDHHQWKGSRAGYTAVHTRLSRRLGKPKKCSSCGTEDPNKVYDWANQTGEYDDINDYRRLCRKCHGMYDAARRKAQRDERDNHGTQSPSANQPMPVFTWSNGRFYRNSHESPIGRGDDSNC